MQKLIDYLQQKFYYLGIIEGFIEPPLTILSISDVILFLVTCYAFYFFKENKTMLFLSLVIYIFIVSYSQFIYAPFIGSDFRITCQGVSDYIVNQQNPYEKFYYDEKHNVAMPTAIMPILFFPMSALCTINQLFISIVIYVIVASVVLIKTNNIYFVLVLFCFNSFFWEVRTSNPTHLILLLLAGSLLFNKNKVLHLFLIGFALGIKPYMLIVGLIYVVYYEKFRYILLYCFSGISPLLISFLIDRDLFIQFLNKWLKSSSGKSRSFSNFSGNEFESMYIFQPSIIFEVLLLNNFIILGFIYSVLLFAVLKYKNFMVSLNVLIFVFILSPRLKPYEFVILNILIILFIFKEQKYFDFNIITLCFFLIPTVLFLNGAVIEDSVANNYHNLIGIGVFYILQIIDLNIFRNKNSTAV